MNATFITIKNSLTAIAAARPVSHLATVALLGTSIYAVHDAAEAYLPTELAKAITVAMVAGEWLQWTAAGRMRQLEDAGETDRLFRLKAQCMGIGALQVLGYTGMVLNIAAKAGLAWGAGWALAGVVVIACLFAALNFFAKSNSCDPVQPKARPARSADEIVFGKLVEVDPKPPGARAPLSLAWSNPEMSADDVGVVSLEDRIRNQEAKAARDMLASAQPAKFKTPALERYTKRTKLAARRAAAG